MVIPSSLPERPPIGTPFRTGWPVRLADTDRQQRLRLDAVARYLQDIGFEHLDAVEDGDSHRGWVVRRTVIDVLKPVVWGERVTLHRWCSALSNRWCNMRVQICGSAGGLIETEAFLIHFGIESGVPTRMSDRFMAPMLASTTEHRLRWQAALTEPMPDVAAADVEVLPFPLRVADIDVLDHVNNAVYLGALEELLAGHGELISAAHRVIIEYAKPLESRDEVRVIGRRAGDTLDAWLAVGDEARAVARVTPR
ncbi:acyl-[acyl-carrier-protein] thioesterase [Nocardia amikacinitolerans]|uniref:acyl-[acyl-carrier-protein] thioesterase n=1 Tax=Nocardia amikacinitolerans TaxID=756689 RepID=UPI0020A5ADC0|nr:acyl-ACP thioesterase domain-containing protein [Nocardia amikacinitolerans]MCP2288984.1 Acyl-ACP thioesterase [Nocardia amikacinitolerans]